MMEIFFSHSLGLTISRKQEKVPLFYTLHFTRKIYVTVFMDLFPHLVLSDVGVRAVKFSCQSVGFSPVQLFPLDLLARPTIHVQIRS